MKSKSGTLLITGGSGYLGAELVARFTAPDKGASARVPHFEEIHATRFATPDGSGDDRIQWHRLDLREEDATRELLDTIRPDVVIHTAGSNRTQENIDSIESGARTLGALARDQGFRLILLSSDLVFDGEQAPYLEDADPRPLSAYGEAKAMAEAILRETCPSAVIARTSLIYGIDPPDHQTRWLLDGVREGTDVGLFRDEIRCPIWVSDLADALLELAVGESTGTIHLVGPEPIDRFTFGSAILDMLGVERPDTVRATSIAESGLVRPRDLTLDSRLARSSLRTSLRSVAEVARLLDGVS